MSDPRSATSRAGAAIGRPRLLAVARLRFASDWRLREHQHDFNELIVPERGGLRARLGALAVEARSGRVLHYARGAAHEEEAIGGGGLIMLYAQWAADPACDPAALPVAALDRGGRVAQALRWMLDLWNGSDPGREAAMDALLAAALHAVANAGRDPRDDLVAVVRAAIAGRLAEPLGLDDLAAAAGLSRFHFARAFRDASGTSPMRWLASLRVQAARTLIATTQMPLRAIAPRVGLGDEHALARAVRRATGMPASAFRSRPD